MDAQHTPPHDSGGRTGIHSPPRTPRPPALPRPIKPWKDDAVRPDRQNLGVSPTSTSGPALEQSGDLVAPLTALLNDDVLFIDKVHRPWLATEELRYSAMEDVRIGIRLSDGAAAQTLPIPLSRFTLVGPRPDSARWPHPCACFGVVHQLAPHDADALWDIV